MQQILANHSAPHFCAKWEQMPTQYDNNRLNAGEYIRALPELCFEVSGRLTRSIGLLLEATGPDLPVGALVLVKGSGLRT